MANNTGLRNANKAKLDEFYTQYEDIQTELNHYEQHFKGKTVLCNCDDPFESNFCKFFLRNFNYLGLKRLICTSYNSSPVAGTQVSFFDLMEDAPTEKGHGYVMDITKVPMKNGRGVSDEDIDNLLKQKKWVKELKGDGDFRSPECIEYLKQADIVVTNPPFSLFREYVATLMKYEKKFIIWSNNNCITYKEFFPYIKNNQIWLGYMANKTCVFTIPNSYEIWDEKITAERNDGHKYGKVPAISVFTNLDIKKRHEKLILWKRYSANDYPTYCNYDAIEVSKVSDIPMDFTGVMGVPITFLDQYNPTQFEIIGNSLELCKKMSEIANKGEYMQGGVRPYIELQNGNYKYKRLYDRLFIKRKE